MLVHEAQIEDILATFPAIAKRVLGSSDELRLIVRQMPLAAGRLDMLFASGSSLLLVELKAETAIEDHVWQIKRYETELLDLQQQGNLISAPLESILLAPDFTPSAIALCDQMAVKPLRYSPDTVLAEFFDQLTALRRFLHIKPKDYGLWNRHLIHRVLYALLMTPIPTEVASSTGLSRPSVMNHLRFAIDLHLVERDGRLYALSQLGRRYVAARNPDMPPSEVSEEQLSILREYIAKNPFGSPIFFGIYTIVDAVFCLARNSYPVTDDLIADYFRKSVGKVNDWKTLRSSRQGMRMHSNYAVELGLLGRLGQALYLTPDGLRFLLLLNLHKSLQMIDTLGLGPTSVHS